ncbi:rhodanese-like domain-containing protein [Frigoribacterium sp. CG_9.8]|uniref:rhodanese-like domain-containing protein n=1 Tax=Frigoribacterium sp. CG_9.8 TaxID=2787733 RepID=UPI0018CB7937|nr:rhodanese-like domain-containing protein [Frigoribacterium sp. CG_9.8]MBG6108052.1 rhodanese-related sulfurtransferase [Frigoribacterium sp. CG_9.8]
MAVSSITAREAITLTGNGTWLLDVRDQDEWDRGHAPSAHLVPLSELPARLAEIPTDQQVLVVCLAGSRSLRAATALAESGVDAVTVSGGMLAWSTANGPLVSAGADAARIE